MQEKYLDIINNSYSSNFNNAVIIDIINDKVYSFDIDKEVRLTNINTFIEYVDIINKTILPEEVEKFFNTISIQALENLKREGKDKSTYFYSKKTTNGIKKYMNIISLVENSKLILIMTIEIDNYENKAISVDNLADNKLKLMSNTVSDAILKIYNTIDSQENNYANNYIKDILEQLTNSYPELKSSFENKLISEVNKSKNTILIVDDDSMTRNLLSRTFKNEYEIIEAENGKVAIDILNKNIDINELDSRENIIGIFLDIAMPVLDGFTVLDFLENNNLLSKIPVIVVSAAEEKETRQKSYKYNIADMLEKPFNLDIIKHRTKNFINLYRTSNTINELVVTKNRDLINLLVRLIKIDNYKIKKYINILLEELSNINQINNSNMYIELSMLAMEYDELLSKGLDPYNSILKLENIKYNPIVINIFKKSYDKFQNIN